MVRFSKVMTKSLASGTGSSESNEFGQDLVFSGVKIRVYAGLPTFDSTSGNLNKTSVREKSGGVYLAIG